MHVYGGWLAQTDYHRTFHVFISVDDESSMVGLTLARSDRLGSDHMCTYIPLSLSRCTEQSIKSVKSILSIKLKYVRKKFNFLEKV